jgi:citrate synthase
MNIKDRIIEKLPASRAHTSKMVKEHGSFAIAPVTVEQIYSGIRGVPIQVSDISYVDPHEGLLLRGYRIPEVISLLPKAPNSEYPLVGGLYYLLMTGEIPTEEEANEVEVEWKVRSNVPDHVIKILRELPSFTHPMTMLSIGLLALQNESIFAKRYYYGIQKGDYWSFYLQDSLNLTAKLPVIVANIYNIKYQSGKAVSPHPSLDWAANFAYMIGKGDDKQYRDLCRLFFILHSDHEGGNVSAHTAHLVGSALSDVYLSCSAGLNGLAGPLHGLANQECLRWLLNIMDKFNGLPTEDQLTDYLRNELDRGSMIPGYGHAVLRVTDPRFTAQRSFAQKYLPDDAIFQLVNLVYEVLPPLLKQGGKISNPYPNVDAIMGALQYHYGIRDFDFYTVLFGLSRVLGFTTHVTWSRALFRPLERPKSLTSEILENMIRQQG